MSVSFSINGLPGAQGSRRYVGKGITVESSKKVAPWRQDVIAAVQPIVRDPEWEPFTQPLVVEIGFTFTRPKAHFRTGKNAHLLRADAPDWVTSRSAGDLDKLLRSTFDALTIAGIWTDDSLVASVRASKSYGPTAGAYVRIVRGNA